MAAKYFIYARGRWCEVDTRNGRVEGFKERARFLFFRGGKLELASTAKVLRGLRALSGGNPGPVRDGPPLPRRKRRHRRRSRRDRESRARHHGCCLHTRCDVNANGYRDKLVLPSLPAPPLPAAPVSPRKRRIIYSDDSPQTHLDKSPVKEKSQKQTHNEQVVENVETGSEEVTRRPTRSTASRVRKDKIEDGDSSKLQKIQKQNRKVLEDKSAELSSEEEIKRSTRNTASKIRNDSNNRDYSKLQKLQKQNLDKLIIDSAESTTEEETKRPTRNTASKVRKDRVDNTDSSEEQVRSPRKVNNREVPNKNQQQKAKKATNNNVSKKDGAQFLVGASETEGSDKQSNCSELAKELVIDEDDVILLRRYLAKRGIGDLDRFDNDEEYKKRVFYRLNPLVTIERYKPLENLLLQKMSLKEFARNLGLRSVAEVTPEKRYRMRLSTKLARVADSETDKENIVQPKRRKLWNNDKEHFTSVTSRSSEIKPRNIPKPALNEDSSKDTTDSDTEFKKKIREQLARKSKQRVSAAERDKETTSTIATEREKEQRTTRSSIRAPGPLKEQNKSSENKKGNGVQAASSEDVRRTRSSDRVRVPVRALKEQNKGSDSSDSPFERSKKGSSPKKGAKETERITGKGNLKRNKGKVEEGKVDDRVEKMKSAVVKSMTAQPAKIRASSVPPGREYTSLEDHAIVAWVSVGDRERRVNGNALWRELQAEYRRITGQDRSWHSLRNRYLRYVLPALGRLALPPQQVSRLRAAAAAGQLKTGGTQRRNSIYDAPVVRSASGRAARPPPQQTPAPKPPADEPPTDKHSPTKATGRSPRRAAPSASPSYSAITRKFARTRAATSLTSSPLTTKRK